MGHWDWPLLFGIVLSSLWQERNQLVFAGINSSLDAMYQSILKQAEFSHRKILNPGSSVALASRQIMQIKWVPLSRNIFKLNTDGSHIHGTHLSACGGLIRNSNGQFISGFRCNLGISTSIVLKYGG